MKNCQKVKNAAAKIWGKFRTKKSLPSSLVSVEYGFYCAIAKINRKKGIGYRVIPDPSVGNWDIILTLDLLSQLEKLPGFGDTEHGSLPNQRNHKLQTHRFGVFRCGADGRIIPWYVYDIDLCGDRKLNSFFVSNASEKTIEAIANKALSVSHRPQKTYYMTWQGQIERMNWIGCLEEESRWYLADQSHDLKTAQVYGDKMRDIAG